MGQYILCGEIAAHPYYVKLLGIRLYSAEELCYYIYNNLFLIEDDFISRTLLLFLREEVKLTGLADKIEKSYHGPADLDMALLLILREVGYYNELEIARFQEKANRLRKQNPLERLRERADQLFTRGRYECAIREYSRILYAKRDLRLKSYFYAQVLQHMGAAYMQLGLCDEALECLEASYKEAQEQLVLKQMYFLAMETGRPYPKMLEQVDAMQLTQWQKDYLEIQNKHLAAVMSDEHQMMFYEGSAERKILIRSYLEREKHDYRTKIMAE